MNRPSTSASPVLRGRAVARFARLGDRLLRRVLSTLQFIGDASAIFVRGINPGNWRRTMCEEFNRFFFQAGIRAIPAVIVVALLVGMGLVVQVLYWLSLVGQEGSIGGFLVMMLVRQIAPVVTVLIVLGRSGSVLLDEVGQFKVDGQIRMLESLGIDPSDLIAVPRCFAMALATFMLTMIFLYVALWSGFIAASLAGLTVISLSEFVDGVLSNMTLGDNLLLLIKPLVTGFVVAYIAIWLGLRVEPSVLAVRQMFPRAFVYSILAVFAIGVAVSAVL